jgi:hypothetical protein
VIERNGRNFSGKKHYDFDLARPQDSCGGALPRLTLFLRIRTQRSFAGE